MDKRSLFGNRMTPNDIIVEQIGLSLETFQMAAESLSDLLIQSSEIATECLVNDGKIVVAGMGASAASGSDFVAKLQSQFERDRPGLPALSLSTDSILTSAISQDFGHGDVYARQIRSICHSPDILLAICTSGKSSAIIKAIQAAHDQGVSVLALTGGTGGDVATLLDENDIELRVESDRLGCIQLTHQLLLNTLVELIENQIFGHEL
jgi:phosphoheptose isomerase